ncbi:(d)CMP kinase [Herbiconiux sp. SYSU D00978]|uniref:(d)CMP kinase n=1 Tax=Herbiconiux sp. SYSU D00978 TaxID=2812562 RepID=UPI001A95F984|nr:(d)CMP kinase [Herbiconiux sp. SYSU D00978]
MSDVTTVAIDGPAGSGKSSVSRAVARALGYAYLDTGAAYRALALACLQQGVDTADAAAAAEMARTADVRLGTDPDDYFVRVGETDVTEEIREPRVSAVVSAIARVPEVRVGLNDRFRDIVEGTAKPGIVVEGRDITTVVLPDADLRILLTASEEARIARRQAQLGDASAAVGDQLVARDRKDLAVVDFMSAAEGVTTVDSTELDFGQTVDAIVELVKKVTD